MRRRAAIFLDCVLLFCLTAALIRPLFQLKYGARWESIESTFIADGRFLKEHWPHPLWQPLWYCGTRFDYIYPPALRYGTALLARIWIPAKAYHIYTAFFYCVGIAGVYFFVRVAAGARLAAWLAAAGAGLLSPSFLLLPAIRHGAFHLTPMRLAVLTRYGEGPHITALSLLPVALAFSWRALQGGGVRMLGLAAVFSTLVALNNFYGAIALAGMFPVAVWSLWVTGRDRRVWTRALGLAALAYGLALFWLVPSYLRITVRNLQFVSDPASWTARLAALIPASLFCAVTWKLGRGYSRRAWPIFVAGNLLLFAWVVLGRLWFHARILGEAGRLIPELDLAMVLAGVELLRRWRRRLPAAFIALACFLPAGEYVRHAWAIHPREPDYTKRIEYRVTDWMAKNHPEFRAMTTGSIRFWYDAWHDLAEMGGGSDQGLLNPLLVPMAFAITADPHAETGILLMKSMGVDAVIVPGKRSREVYHDFVQPEKFTGLLPVLWDDREGTIIYGVPRRFPGLARVVNTSLFESLRPIRDVLDVADLRAYVEAVENGPDSQAEQRWEGTDGMRIHAAIAPGQSLIIQETYDPAWRAYSRGRALPIRRDMMGWIWIAPPPGEHDIRLVFELPLENRIGRAVSLLCLAAVLVAMFV